MPSNLKNYIDRLEAAIDEAQGVRKEKLLLLQKQLTSKVEHQIIQFYMHDEAVTTEMRQQPLITGKPVEVYTGGDESSADINSPLLWQYNPNSVVIFIEAFFDYVEKESKYIREMFSGGEASSSKDPKGKRPRHD